MSLESAIVAAVRGRSAPPRAARAAGIDDAADELHWMLAPLRPERLVPMVDRNERLVGVVVLGGRQSEEPYSGEDIRLLTVVSLQSALTVQTICLSEEMAARIEVERRAGHEVEIAKEVQRQLLPARAPALSGLACARACIQAKSVGGDYYDFIELGADRVALVLADVSGKGIAAALLMANLQATLRSQYASAVDDPAKLLEHANRLFFASTPGNAASQRQIHNPLWICRRPRRDSRRWAPYTSRGGECRWPARSPHVLSKTRGGERASRL